MADEDEIIVAVETDPLLETEKPETPPRGADGKFVKADAEPSDDLVQQFKDQAEDNRKRAEAAEQRERTERQGREAAERREQAAHGQVADSQLDTVSSGLAAAQTDAEAASAEYQSAMEAGDFARAAKAQRRIASAEAKIVRLDEAKADLEARKTKTAEEPAKTRTEQTAETRAAADPVEAYIANRTEPTAKWLREHKDWITDDKKNRKLTAAHWEAVDDQGLKPDTPEYFEFVETKIGLKQPAKTNGNGAAKPTRRSSVPVAPVQASGGGTNGGGTEVRLSQREAAAAVDGTHIYNYDDPSPQKRFKKGDPIGIQEMARRKHEMTKQGLYDKSYVES